MEFKKKDLRTLDVVTYREGAERTVMLGTPKGDVLCEKGGIINYLKYYQDDLTQIDGLKYLDIIKVTRNGKVIFERTDKLPYGAWYRFKNGASKMMALYTDETTAFGLNVRGEWVNKSDRWTPLNSGQLEPVPTEEWQARLIEHANEIGYAAETEVKSLVIVGLISNIDSDEFQFKNGDLWKGGTCIFQLKTGKWAEITKSDQTKPTEEAYTEISRFISYVDSLPDSIRDDKSLELHLADYIKHLKQLNDEC